MSRIHPAYQNRCHEMLTVKERSEEDAQAQAQPRPSVLTVWKRSSMTFQGTDGFTVFDHHGRLAFRVDNYSRKSCCITGGELVLMDGAGNALLTLKPQVLSMQYQWNAYRGEDKMGKSRSSKVFSMRSGSRLFHSSKDEAIVMMGATTKHGQTDQSQTPDFRIEGCFRRRNCKIKSSAGAMVAKIARKRVNNRILLGDDVFSLAVQPGFDTQLIMAFVIILDRICDFNNLFETTTSEPMTYSSNNQSVVNSELGMLTRMISDFIVAINQGDMLASAISVYSSNSTPLQD